MRFAGLCAYPHGGFATAGLFFTVAAALAATCYGIASCRLLAVTFETTSTNGGSCLEDYFQVHTNEWTTTSTGNSQANMNTNANATISTCRVGMGLFQWLRPNDVSSDGSWQDGYCVGYQQSMLNALGEDDLFDVARGLGIFSVIISFVLLGWSFVMSCLELNWMQMILLRFCLFLACLTSGCSFLMKRTDLCETMFEEASECKLDQGGLAMITACVLWMIALLVTILFMEASTVCPFCLSRASRQRRVKGAPGTPNTKTGLQEAYSFDSTESWTKPVRRKEGDITVDDVSNQEAMEVYISGRLDKIEALADDEEDDDVPRARRSKQAVPEGNV